MATKSKQQGKSRKSPPMMHRVRIIGGQWKRTPLPVAAIPDLRPTPDRVRETLFNWLSHLCEERWEEMRCLDLFAGTGALGFEAASRGAIHVMMVESYREAFSQLQEIREKLRAKQIDLIWQDAAKAVKQMQSKQERFKLIFLDPPYEKNLLPEMLRSSEALLEEKGWVYLESNIPLETSMEQDFSDWALYWDILRQDRAGQVHYYLLQLK